MMEDPTGMIRDMGADCLVTLPFDDEIARAAETGQGIHTVQMSNPVLSGMKRFVSRLNLAGEKVRGKKSETG